MLPVVFVSQSRRKWEEAPTRLHGDEAGPGIVGAAVAQSGDKAACDDRYICVFEADLVLQIT